MARPSRGLPRCFCVSAAVEVIRDFNFSKPRIPPPCSGFWSFSECCDVYGCIGDIVSNVILPHLGDLVPKLPRPEGKSAWVCMREPFQLPVFLRDRSDKSDFFSALRRFAYANAVIPCKTTLLYRLCVPRALHDVSVCATGSLHCRCYRRRLRGFPTGAVLVLAPP